MKITLKKGSYGAYLITTKYGNSLLFQVDYEFPSLARDFGWNIAEVKKSIGDNCSHDESDGTIACSCGLFPMDFISAAKKHLDDSIGDTVEDPGYF